ncbi:uncharacterized protein TNCV_4624441 [Trichonephila clavipes]|nr:uncharacterized protein TNCV_4624441 [Trichonephila clavipes]
MPDIKIDDNGLFEVERRLNAHSLILINYKDWKINMLRNCVPKYIDRATKRLVVGHEIDTPGVQVYQVASASNLDKLERVQLSATKVITGLHNSCPRDFVYYDVQHRTSSCMSNGNDNRRLKKGSPFSYAEIEGWLHNEVNVCGNEIADGLAREGSRKDSAHGGCLTFSEIATRVKQDISSSWRQAPVQKWLRSGHTRDQKHAVGLKVYPPCPNCNVTEAAPAHILDCIGCHKSQLLLSPSTVLHCLKMRGTDNSSFVCHFQRTVKTSKMSSLLQLIFMILALVGMMSIAYAHHHDGNNPFGEAADAAEDAAGDVANVL